MIKSARRMGIATVAVYSDADRDAVHVESERSQPHLLVGDCAAEQDPGPDPGLESEPLGCGHWWLGATCPKRPARVKGTGNSKMRMEIRRLSLVVPVQSMPDVPAMSSFFKCWPIKMFRP